MNAPLDDTLLAQPFDVFHCPLDGINLVEASAGTGKTWNICGLYLRLLLERGHRVEKILVVTFTNAATAELRERIRARLVEMLAYAGGRALDSADPFVPALAQALESRGITRASMQERLDLALQSFDQAAILTIHGWAQRALADTPFAAGRPFDVDLQPDDRELRMAAVHDFWRRHVAGDGCSTLLAAWLEASQLTPDKLGVLLGRHLAKPLARERWPEAIDEPLHVDADALDAAYDTAQRTWAALREEIVARVVPGTGVLRGNVYKDTSIAKAAEDWDEWFAHDVLMPIKWKDRKLRLLSTSCLVTNTNKGKTTPRHPFFDQAETLIEQRKASERSLDLARLRLVRTMFDEAGQALRDAKRAARLVSYDDLLRNLYDALQPPDGVLHTAVLRERFPVALIDEFQDTDPLQFAIFRAIYGQCDAPLFLVGDPKQAIYSFRHADLHTYLQAAREARSAWTLDENQRSTPGLIAAVNRLFDANPHAFMLEGLAYHDVHVGAKPRKVLEARTGGHGDLRIWTLPRYSDGEPLERRAALDAAATATAAEVARLLRAGLAGEITLSGAPLAPHDIAVLVRTHRQGDAIKQALAAVGVGSVELSQATVFKTPDAEDVERVLAAILSPSDTGRLRAALATEIVGLDAAAIARLSEDETALMPHVERFRGYRDQWEDAGVSVMFRDLLARERVATRMLARPDGERRLTNLLHLGELLHTAAETHGAPDALLRWLGTQRRDDAHDEVAQLRLESDRNLVQIVTVHKAKGLEYPFVFCPFLWDAFRVPSRPIEGCEYHDDDDRAVVDFRGEEEMGEDAKPIQARIRLEKSAEDVRLMYVALTRASHRCYLIAGCYARKTSGGLSPKESGCGLLNWLVAGGATSPDGWLKEACPTDDIDDAWARLATELAPAVECSPLSTAPGEPVRLSMPAPDTVAALPPPKAIAAPWRISSFSALHHGATTEAAAVDHDTQVESAVETSTDPAADDDVSIDAAPPLDEPVARATRGSAVPPSVPPDDILRFPRGIGAGDCLHAALENVDFTDETTWDRAIDRALRDHPVSLRGVAPAAEHATLRRMMAGMLRDVVSTELHDGLRLDAVPSSRRLNELRFNMPAHGLNAGALNTALKTLGYRVGRLHFTQLQGYLAGSIDLVLEHAGRYYIVDWKSNYLGHTPAEYGTQALGKAMAEHGYHLQALLYSVALQRYLAHRIPAYQHDTHFGGVLYLFVRGVRPAWTAEGAPAGVHFDRPSAETIATLDGLLTAAAGARHVA